MENTAPDPSLLGEPSEGMSRLVKKIASLLLSCLLSLAVVACNGSTPTPQAQSPKSNVEPIREYACELVNYINRFEAEADQIAATGSRSEAANICRDIEIDYCELKEMTFPPELKPAQDYVVDETNKYLHDDDGAWIWAAIEEKDDSFRKQLKRRISDDVWEIRDKSVALVEFIDKLYVFVGAFEGMTTWNALTVSDHECDYHEFQDNTCPSQLQGAKAYVLGGTREYLDKVWDYCRASETGDEVRAQFKEDVFGWYEMPSRECVISPSR
jgi:hypothetical protein